MYEYDTNTSLKELKFTLDSTLGEILDEPLGMKMMEEMQETMKKERLRLQDEVM